MPGITHVKDILADNIAHYVKDAHDGNIFIKELRGIRCDHSPLIMKENGDGATLTKIYVVDIPSGSLVLKPDNFNVHLLFYVFANELSIAIYFICILVTII